MTGSVRVVHVVAKTHLDLGFTALAHEVEAQYLDDFFPRAVAVAERLRERGGPERLVWTTGSWILHRALEADPDLAGAVAAGDLAWHAYPLTTHTELMDPALVRAGLRISSDLDARFGRPPTTAAKMTDVPGHTRGLVPLLAEAGITFLHIGVNPAWPIPEVPPVFTWQAPDGSSVTVAYQSGGYGGQVRVRGCDEVLAFLHGGDNLGPPTADHVIAAHAQLAAEFPGAEIRGSTLDAFARALAASGATADLPVVTAEIGDPWIFGCASDPMKVAAYRHCLHAWHAASRFPRPPEVERVLDHALLRVAEHTWGLDEKIAMDPQLGWDRAALAAIRQTEAGRRYESSWAEQRAYLRDAHDRLDRPLVVPPYQLVLEAGHDRLWAGPRSLEELQRTATHGRWTALETTRGPIRSERFVLDVDRATGAVNHLVDRADGRILADPDHRLGELTYQSFDEADYERFYAGLAPTPEDEWWARRDNTKPGIDASGATSGRWTPDLVGAWWFVDQESDTVVLKEHLRFAADLTDRLGAPPEAWCTWTFVGERSAAALEVTWLDKPANRLPEAMWCSFVPRVAEPDRWVMQKLGQEVSPLDVVRRGGRSLHAVEQVSYEGPDGRLQLRSKDAPLVAPGRPNLLDADPPLPDLRGGWHVLLHDNCWGTNFPMWSEGSASFRFSLQLG